MNDEIKLKKTRFCLKCTRFFRCKGSVDVATCINFIPRESEEDNVNDTTNDKDD